jgi:hypothetical protein
VEYDHTALSSFVTEAGLNHHPQSSNIQGIVEFGICQDFDYIIIASITTVEVTTIFASDFVPSLFT